MTGGTEFQEAAEAPQEIREVSEIRDQLDRAAFEPEAAAERFSDIKQAEDVQEAFVAAVQLAEAAEVVVVEVGSEQSAVDGGETLRSVVAEALEDQSYGSESEPDSSIKSPARDLPIAVSGEGNEPAAVMGDLSVLGSPDKDPESEVPATEDSGGKSAFGSENLQPGDHYAGVEMIQGEVAQDSDWNEDPGQSEEADEGDKKTPTSDVPKAVQQDEKAVEEHVKREKEKLDAEHNSALSNQTADEESSAEEGSSVDRKQAEKKENLEVDINLSQQEILEIHEPADKSSQSGAVAAEDPNLSGGGSTSESGIPTDDGEGTEDTNAAAEDVETAADQAPGTDDSSSDQKTGQEKDTLPPVENDIGLRPDEGESDIQVVVNDDGTKSYVLESYGNIAFTRMVQINPNQDESSINEGGDDGINGEKPSGDNSDDSGTVTIKDGFGWEGSDPGYKGSGEIIGRISVQGVQKNRSADYDETMSNATESSHGAEMSVVNNMK